MENIALPSPHTPRTNTPPAGHHGGISGNWPKEPHTPKLPAPGRAAQNPSGLSPEQSRLDPSLEGEATTPASPRSMASDASSRKEDLTLQDFSGDQGPHATPGGAAAEGGVGRGPVTPSNPRSATPDGGPTTPSNPRSATPEGGPGIETGAGFRAENGAHASPEPKVGPGPPGAAQGHADEAPGAAAATPQDKGRGSSLVFEPGKQAERAHAGDDFADLAGQASPRDMSGDAAPADAIHEHNSDVDASEDADRKNGVRTPEAETAAEEPSQAGEAQDAPPAAIPSAAEPSAAEASAAEASAAEAPDATSPAADASAAEASAAEASAAEASAAEAPAAEAPASWQGPPLTPKSLADHNERTEDTPGWATDVPGEERGAESAAAAAPEAGHVATAPSRAAQEPTSAGSPGFHLGTITNAFRSLSSGSNPASPATDHWAKASAIKEEPEGAFGAGNGNGSGDRSRRPYAPQEHIGEREQQRQPRGRRTAGRAREGGQRVPGRGTSPRPPRTIIREVPEASVESRIFLAKMVVALLIVIAFAVGLPPIIRYFSPAQQDLGGPLRDDFYSVRVDPPPVRLPKLFRLPQRNAARGEDRVDEVAGSPGRAGDAAASAKEGPGPVQVADAPAEEAQGPSVLLGRAVALWKRRFGESSPPPAVKGAAASVVIGYVGAAIATAAAGGGIPWAIAQLPGPLRTVVAKAVSPVAKALMGLRLRSRLGHLKKAITL